MLKNKNNEELKKEGGSLWIRLRELGGMRERSSLTVCRIVVSDPAAEDLVDAQTYSV